MLPALHPVAFTMSSMDVALYPFLTNKPLEASAILLFVCSVCSCFLFIRIASFEGRQ